MKELHLENAFPAAPSTVHERVQSTLAEVQTMKNIPIRRPASALVAALLIAALLTGAALAATHFGLTDYLFSNPRDLGGSVQDIGGVYESDGIRVTLTEAMYDGYRLAVAYTIENTDWSRPALIVQEDGTADGKPLSVAFGGMTEDCWAPDLQWEEYASDPDPERYDLSGNGGFIAHILGEQPAGEFTVAIPLSILRPTRDIVFMKDYQGEDDDENIAFRSKIRDLMRAGTLPVEHCWIIHPIPNDQDADYPEDMLVRGALCDATDLAEYYGALKKTGEITLRFTLDAERSKKDVIDRTPAADIDANGDTVHFREMVFTPLTTRICFEITPAAAETAGTLSARYNPMRLLDENGEELQWDGEYEYGVHIPWRPDGVVTASGEFALPALETPPRAITFYPENAPEYAFTVEIERQ